MALKDRLLTRRGAEALMAPSAILTGGAIAAVGIAVGAPIVAAAAAGAAAYAAWVYRRLPASVRPAPARSEIDLGRLRDPWRHYVQEALDAQTRYLRAVAGTDQGPIRDRLADIGQRIDDGVRECWRIALRGQELERALRELVPVDQVQQRIAELRSRPPSPSTEGLVEALQSQADSYRRIAATAADARQRLEILEARLDEAVARAVELSLQTADSGELGGLHADVQAVVGEMEALRRGLEEAAA